MRAIRLSRNFGHQMALTAGMDLARGQAVITLDSDLQDPPELIPTLAAAWRAGGEVVYAQRTRRRGETLFKRATAAAYYRLLRRLTALDIPPDTGDYRLLDRRVVDALSQFRERRRYLRGLVVWAGFRQVAVPYERQQRHAGTTKYPLRKMLALALDGITSFSDAPLRLAGLIGLALLTLGALGLALAATLYALSLASLTVALIAVLAALLAFLSGLQLTFTGVLGLYLASLADEARARPLYIVSEMEESRHANDTEQRVRGSLRA